MTDKPELSRITSDDGPMFMVVTFKSGARVRLQVTDYTLGRNALGGLVELKWTAAEETRSMIRYIDIGEIAAIETEWPDSTDGD